MERPAARRFTANTKSANFCATVHGYEEYVKGGKDIWYVLSHLPKACYVIAGKEVAPTTGAKHLQCYIQFDMRKKLSAVVALLKGDTQHVHVEPAMGSSDDNIKYCSKEDLEAWTWGEVNEVRVNDMITECVPDSAELIKTWDTLMSDATEHCNYKGETYLNSVKKDLGVDFYLAKFNTV